MKINQLAYMPFWFIKNVIFKKHGPLQTVLFITDYCNLRCRHCFEMGHACTIQKTYKQIKEELEYAYGLGSRIVDLEGGEPTLWKEDGKDINDVIALAKEIGYFSVTVTTNAQKDFSWVNADLIWVSLDGYEKYHDEIRGEGAFEKLNKNAFAYRGMDTDGNIVNREIYEKNKKRALGSNMAINRFNYTSVDDTVEFVKRHPAIDSIAINFHTPYPGTEHMMLKDTEKSKVIDKIIEYKKKRYPIQNSVSGLAMMKKKGFKKYCWISNFIITDGTRFKTCPGETLGICDECGFCMAGEMYSVMHLKIDTLLAGLKLRL